MIMKNEVVVNHDSVGFFLDPEDDFYVTDRGVIKRKKYCECGCGEVVKEGRKWIHGHHITSKKFLEDRTKKIKETWIKKKLGIEIKEPTSICLCGCGQETNPGSIYTTGHQNRGANNKNKELTRICPHFEKNENCLGVIKYKNPGSMAAAESKGSLCAVCKKIKSTIDSLNRPKSAIPCACGCGEYPYEGRRLIYHHVSEDLRLNISQRFKGRKKSEESRKKLSESRKAYYKTEEGLEFLRLHAERLSEIMKGENNPFYGCHHSDETKHKISQLHKDGIIGFKNKKHSEEAKRRIAEANIGRIFSHSEESKTKISEAMKGENNPFYGCHHSDETKKKLSEANTGKCYLTEEQLKERSIKYSGKGNPSYGKLTKGGRGISGWFNGIYFRSSCELVFLLENQDILWESAGNKKFRLKYKDCSGKPRFYFPDFFGNNRLIEIKPLGFMKSEFLSENIEFKKNAAKEKCFKEGWTYELIELPCLSQKYVFELRKKEVITLNSRWERKYQKWLEKQA